MSDVDLEALRKEAAGNNINETTLLATDYLNHFNEVVMLIEMLPDMPDMLEDIQEWQPKTYEQHFEQSVFAAKDLAIKAYQNSPPQYKEPFDLTIRHLNQMVEDELPSIEQVISEDNPDKLSFQVGELTKRMHRFIDIAGGIINGAEGIIDQNRIDEIMAG